MDKESPFKIISNDNVEHIEERLAKQELGVRFINLMEEYSQYCSQGYMIEIGDHLVEYSTGLIPNRWVCRVKQLKKGGLTFDDRPDLYGFGDDVIDAVEECFNKLGSQEEAY